MNLFININFQTLQISRFTFVTNAVTFDQNWDQKINIYTETKKKNFIKKIIQMNKSIKYFSIYS